MKYLLGLFGLIILMSCTIKAQNKMEDKKGWKVLSEEEKRVIINKGTEYPFTGEYYDNKDSGTYNCKQCHQPLFESNAKFNSGTGWPSFDDAISGAVREVPDADGRRVEIVCSNCGGHLGHVFKGEGFTDKNTRHCVNSISLDFEPAEGQGSRDTAYFASGCFWGTEYYLQKIEGVISTDVGYMGGHVKQPTYKEVCTGRTGHAETVRVLYDPRKVSFETLARHFFETHDPTQVDRQGPDIGTQYRSEIFYKNDEQKKISEKLIEILKDKGLNIATNLTAAPEFWKGEGYHQDYYDNKGGTPYCHGYRKLF